MRMRICLAVASGVLWLAPHASHAQTGPEETLRLLTVELFRSTMVENDASLMAAVTLPEFLVIPPAGFIEDRTEALDGIAAFAVDSITVGEMRVVVHDGTALVIGRLDMHGEVRGVGAIGPMRFMNVFVETDAGWRLLGRSLTPCAARTLAAGRC